jgi:hypothetical protein
MMFMKKIGFQDSKTEQRNKENSQDAVFLASTPHVGNRHPASATEK